LIFPEAGLGVLISAQFSVTSLQCRVWQQ